MTLRRLRHGLEAGAAWLGFGLLGSMPRRWASALGGALARHIGPWLPVSDVARRNIARALPGLDKRAIERIVAGMWDNLGRTVAEYAHLGAIDCFASGGPVEVVGAEALAPLRDAGRTVVFVSAHFGNWEIASLAAGQFGMPIHHVYRRAGNPGIDRMIQRFRGATLGVYHPKGGAGTRELVRAVKRGQHLGMLLDQKLNEGIAIPFFGRPAMTAPALAELAIRYALAVVPARVERLAGTRFRVTAFPPLPLPASGDNEADVRALLLAINRTFEAWIRERPDHWLWLHRRWED
ncbi:MAG: lauroyl acyltransferase [Alphaproteobacteria bacterium]